MAIGVVSGAGAVKLCLEQREFYDHAERTMGTVLVVNEKFFSSLIGGRGNHGYIGYIPVFEYTDCVGTRHRVISEVESKSRNDYQPGQRLPVLYRTDRPWDARLDSFTAAWRDIVVLSLIGAIFTVCGGLFIRGGCLAYRGRRDGKRA